MMRLTALVLLLATSAAAFGDPVFVYGMTKNGRLNVNSTLLDKMPSNYDADDLAPFTPHIWSDLFVLGSDRWAIRRDGKIYKNGKKIDTLTPPPTAGQWWIDIFVSPFTGTIFAIRSDGLLSVGSVDQGTLPDGGTFFFQQVFGVDAPAPPGGIPEEIALLLRSDGSVFLGVSEVPIIPFFFGDGDGTTPEKAWQSMAINIDGTLWAIRRDGKVMKVDLLGILESLGGPEGTPPIAPEVVGELPFTPSALKSFEFVDIAFTLSGTMIALRADGEVYTDDDFLSPLIDYPGTANQPDFDRHFTDLATLPFSEDIFAIRGDGFTYTNLDTDELFNMPKTDYVRLAVSSDPPDLTNFKNQKPVGARYKIEILGEPKPPDPPSEGAGEGPPMVIVPVIANDIDKPADELIVLPTEKTLEKMAEIGAIWNAVDRQFEWGGPFYKGGYKFQVTVDDGENKPRKVTSTVKVKLPDAKPEKNKKPRASKFKKARALVDTPFEFTLYPFDQDPEDEGGVVITVDPETLPAGATFGDAEEPNTFSWTPTFDDIGKHKITFFIDDGNLEGKLRKLKVKIKVEASLIFSETP